MNEFAMKLKCGDIVRIKPDTEKKCWFCAAQREELRRGIRRRNIFFSLVVIILLITFHCVIGL